MAKVRGGLFSLEAKGSIGNALNYQMPPGGGIVRLKSKSGGQPSAAQLARRAAYKSLVASWKALTQPQKQVFKDSAKTLGITGWNLYLKQNLSGSIPPSSIVWTDLVGSWTDLINDWQN